MRLQLTLTALLICATSFTTLAFSNSSNMPEDIKAHFSVNGSQKFHVMPGKPATIEVVFTDPRRTPDEEETHIYKDFKKMHGKIMHMVLIKNDLSVFKHIHPYFDPITGRFMITLNMPLSDPDNFHTKDAIIEPGMYMVMADVEIRGVGMRMSHFMLHVHGKSPMKPLALNEVNNEGLIQNTFTKNGSDYKVEMSQNIIRGCGSNLVEFRVNLLVKNESGDYIPGKDFQPWLTQGAHSVWVSKKFMHKHGMHFAHMHSMLPVENGDSTFIFNFHDNKIMKAGLQKIWFQIKHNNEVLTIPLIFNYQPGVLNESC